MMILHFNDLMFYFLSLWQLLLLLNVFITFQDYSVSCLVCIVIVYYYFLCSLAILGYKPSTRMSGTPRAPIRSFSKQRSRMTTVEDRAHDAWLRGLYGGASSRLGSRSQDWVKSYCFVRC